MKDSISQTLLRRRPMEIGKIKIGRQKPGAQKKGAGKAPPEKLGHFLVVTRARGDDDNFIPDASIHEKVGPEPTALKIRLRHDRPEENFHSRMVEYDGQRLVVECDGETCLDRSTGEETHCRRATGGGCQCKPFGRLAVVLEDSDHYGGVHVLRTSSWESIGNILSTLDHFYETFGSVRGLPLQLVLYPATDQVQDGKTVKSYTNWKVGIELRASFEAAARIALDYHRSDQLTRGELKQLAAGDRTALAALDAADEVEIANEFFFQDGLEVGSVDLPPAEHESQEEEQDQAEDTDLEALRGRYHALLTEVIPRARAREDLRHAFHQVHPELPDSEKEWQAAHYVLAIGIVQRRGTEVFDRAVAALAQQDPAADTEVEALKELVAASNASAQAAEDVWWVINTGVGTWVRRELERLKLQGIQQKEAGEEPDPSQEALELTH